VLFLSCSSAETPKHSLGRGGNDSDVVNHLKEVEGYFKEVRREEVRLSKRLLLIVLFRYIVKDL
jgi:hypothetical protein